MKRVKRKQGQEGNGTRKSKGDESQEEERMTRGCRKGSEGDGMLEEQGMNEVGKRKRDRKGAKKMKARKKKKTDMGRMKKGNVSKNEGSEENEKAEERRARKEGKLKEK